MVTEEKRCGREDGVIVPAFDTGFLQEFEGVKTHGIQVAVQQELARPAHLGQAAVRVEEGSGLGEEGLHGGLLWGKVSDEDNIILNHFLRYIPVPNIVTRRLVRSYSILPQFFTKE